MRTTATIGNGRASLAGASAATAPAPDDQTSEAGVEAGAEWACCIAGAARGVLGTLPLKTSPPASRTIAVLAKHWPSPLSSRGNRMAFEYPYA